MAANTCRRTLVSWLFTILFIGCFIRDANAQETVVVMLQTTVEVATTGQAVPTATNPPSYTSPNDIKNTILRVSNRYRSAHDASPLVWNETLVKYAQNWADACIWQHSHGPYGENLAYGYPNASAAVAAWGDEGAHYDFSRPTGFTEATGHFTQLVWRSTSEVGCAAVNCGYTEDHGKRRRRTDSNDAGILGSLGFSKIATGNSRAQGWFVVCEYHPAGNVVGEHNKFFRLNVLAGNSSKTSTSTRPTGRAMTNLLDSTLGMTLLALGTVGMGMGLYT